MPDEEPSLDSAYQIATPEDAERFYGQWANDYERDFAERHGYAAPRLIAGIYHARMGNGDQPVLDIGAGTGLVAVHLAPALPGPIDGIDISAEMLEVARAKKVYRNLIVADLMKPLDIPDGTYGGLISGGTFTHGHVGPTVLPELLRICRPGALCVFSIKREVFDEERFGSALASLVAERRITPLDFELIRFYERDDHEHAQDVGLAVIFRKAG